MNTVKGKGFSRGNKQVNMNSREMLQVARKNRTM